MGDEEQNYGAAFPTMPYKRSQRPSWSCTECARRKIKCDKRVPCQSCVKRGRADQCRLEGAASLSRLELSKSDFGQASTNHSVRKQEAREPGNADGLPRSTATSISPTSEARQRLTIRDAFDRSPSTLDHGNSDGVTSALVRLQSQLDRIERRLSNMDDRSDTFEHLTARVTDVEDVIQVLGENGRPWQELGPSPRKVHDGVSPSRTNIGHHRDYTASSSRSNWADLDAVAGHGSDDRRMLQNTSTLSQQIGGVEGPNQVRNAELESKDAATTLEFLTLGKDRRQGLALNEASSDSEQDFEENLSHSADQARSHPRKKRNSIQLKSTQTEASGNARMLKHLRHELPAEILKRIEFVLRQQVDVLPPSNLLARPSVRPMTDSIKAIRLSPFSVRGIVYIAKDIGAWQHCCVHFPTFEREVEAYLTITSGDDTDRQTLDKEGQESAFEGWKAIDPAWMALFFVICSIAIHQMSPEEGAQCNLKGESYRSRLASDLLHAAMDSLSLADYLVKPSTYSCQTIAILCVAGHNICGSDLLTSLLAIGIKSGQTLNLHAMGKTASFLETCAEQRNQVLVSAGIHAERSGSCRLPDETHKQFALWKKRIIDLEVGKRVWWAFTQQDYFAIPFSGCFSIVEGQYDTPLPHNCSDEDLEDGRLINRKVEELTVASKQRFTCHVAKIVCDFFEDLNKTKGIPSFSLVLHHEQRLNFVTDRFRACLSSNQDIVPSSTLPSFSTVLQHYLFISVNHKILVMHRAFLSRRVSAEEREISHASSIETARAVLHELERGLGLNSDGGDKPQLDLQSRMHGGALWTIPYHSVAAATILALDIFRAPTSRPGQDHKHRLLRRQEVERALSALGRLTKKSAIARRGCQLLSNLLEEGRRFDERLSQQGKRKASNDNVHSVMKRIRLPEDEDSKSDVVEGSHHPNLQAHTAITSPEIGDSEQRFDSNWLDKFSADTVQSQLTSSVHDGHTPDDLGASTFGAASFGYRSSNFNPLAGNSTSSRAMHNGTVFPQISAADSLSSMFLSSDASAPNSGAAYELFPFSHPQAHAHQTTASKQGGSTHQKGFHQGHTQNAGSWHNDTGAALWNDGGNGMTAPPTVDINMPQQHLAQILPALESMPDVWKLFDGTLGQSLVAFEESGF